MASESRGSSREYSGARRRSTPAAGSAGGGVSVSGWLLPAAVVCLACLGASRALLPSLWRSGDRPLAGAVATYMVVITTAAVLAGATGRPLVAAGAALFVVSDTILSMDKFLRPVRHGHLWVMATYLSAIALLTLGVLRRERSGV